MRQKIAAAGIALPVLAALLSWISTGNLAGFWSFLGVLILAAALLAAGIAGLKPEGLPAWLISLTIGAAVLRLAAGILWFVLLPNYGYETEVNQAGYVMEDAYQRDRAAWVLGVEGQPLIKAFTGMRAADQYGGLLFISAVVYRYLGGGTHMPLMMVALTAAFSALAVPYTWAFARRVLDNQTAKWAAWGLALYPEAVLLGSSQMREAFMMPLAAMALYGLCLYAKTRDWRGIAWIAGVFFTTLPLSPPLAGILIGLLTIVGLALDNWRVLRNWRLWAAFGGLAALVVVIILLGWEQISPRLNLEYENFWVALQRWITLSAEWQAGLTLGASGWLQRVFEMTPGWMNLPFLLAYGFVRPFLPAQLLAYSVPAWWGIGVWRALGWAVLLPLLIYAPLRSIRMAENRSLVTGLALAAWAGIAVASFWGGGDQWDNPRYRVAFITLQAVLASWAVVSQKRAPDPWAKRALVGVGTLLVWFVPWYLRRYSSFDQVFGWTVIDIFKVLGLGAATTVLYWIWDWMGSAQRTDIENPG